MPKLNPETVVKFGLIVFAAGGAWATLVAGQVSQGREMADFKAGQKRIEQHVAAIDSSLLVARYVFATREEIQVLSARADSIHHEILRKAEDVDARLRHIEHHGF